MNNHIKSISEAARSGNGIKLSLSTLSFYQHIEIAEGFTVFPDVHSGELDITFTARSKEDKTLTKTFSIDLNDLAQMEANQIEQWLMFHYVHAFSQMVGFQHKQEGHT